MRRVERVYVVHGIWAKGGGLNLWAEDASLRVSARQQSLRQAREHPVALSHNELRQLITPTMGVLGMDEVNLEYVQAREPSILMALPSLARSPLDSPELISSAPATGGNLR